MVKFTPELLKKMEAHDIQFLKDKVTGELLPDLYDYTTKGIGGKVRLEVKGKPTGQDLTNLSNSISNLIEQQRYEALVEEIQQLHIYRKKWKNICCCRSIFKNDIKPPNKKIYVVTNSIL